MVTTPSDHGSGGVVPRAEPDALRSAAARALFRGLLLVALTVVVIVLAVSPGFTPVEGGDNNSVREPFAVGLLPELAEHLERNYLDPQKLAEPRELLRRAFVALETSVDEIYVENSDPDDPYVRVHIGNKVHVYDLLTVDRLSEAVPMLNALFRYIQNNYEGELSVRDIQYDVLNGFLTGLDPHTLVFSPKEFEDFSVHIEGEIAGVGMYVGTRDGKLTAVEILKGTPAERAGFQRGDVIVQIGDESTVNMTVLEAVDIIRGPIKSTVTLTVKRKSKDDPKKVETLAIDVVRERVVIKSVESSLIRDWKGPGLGSADAPVGYVSIRNFDKNTTSGLVEHLEKLSEQNEGKPLAGLILDFRGNSGGLLDQAVKMCDLFLKEGDVVVQAYRGRLANRQRAVDDGSEPEMPLVVLGDERSASGAEIVIGALQRNDRAVVLGTRTFGKGSVQQLHPLHSVAPKVAQLKITVSEYLIPGDISIQENGVVPDIRAIPVVLNGDLTAEEFDLFPDEDRLSERNYNRRIVSRFARDEKPAHTIKYLHVPEEYDPDNDLFVRGELTPTTDKLVTVALSVLEELRETPKRSEMLAEKSAAIRTLGDSLFGEIVTKLGELGIDWTAGPAPERPSVELSLSTKLIQEPSGDEEDPVPINKLLVTAKLKNRGDETLYRVKGRSSSDYVFYRDREFLFGKIEPGATVERSLRVTLPYFPIARSDVMGVELSGHDNAVFATAETAIALSGAGRPRFSISTSLVDRETDAALGHLSPGREVRLRAVVTNTGNGPSHKGALILRNETGRQIFLTKGRIEFKDLAPGEESVAEFEFSVRDGEPVSEYELEVAAIDTYAGASISRRLKIPSEDDGGLPPKEITYEAPRITARLNASPETSGQPEPLLVTSLAAVELEAKVSTPTGVPFKFWIVRTTGARHSEELPDKIFYDDSKGATEASFSTRVALEEGTNVFTLVAHDRNELETRERLVIRRATPEK